MPEVRTTSSTGGQKGTKLARFDLIPVGPLTELAEHYGIGASKYANHQWRKGYEWSKSYSALMRHLTAFWAGQDYDVCSNDPEGCSHVDLDGEPFVAIREDACFNHTGSHHMAAVAWHAFLLMEFKDVHPEHDDRHKPVSNTLEATTAGDWHPDHPDRVAARANRNSCSVDPHAFPRVRTGLPTLAEAMTFDFFDPDVDIRSFQEALNSEVRRILLAEDEAMKQRLRDIWGPDLLSKRVPSRWDRG